MSLIQIQSFQDYVSADTLKIQNTLCAKLQIQVKNYTLSWPQGDESEADLCYLPKIIFTGYMNTGINRTLWTNHNNSESLPGSFARDAFPIVGTQQILVIDAIFTSNQTNFPYIHMIDPSGISHDQAEMQLGYPPVYRWYQIACGWKHLIIKGISSSQKNGTTEPSQRKDPLLEYQFHTAMQVKDQFSRQQFCRKSCRPQKKQVSNNQNRHLKRLCYLQLLRFTEFRQINHQEFCPTGKSLLLRAGGWARQTFSEIT